MPASPIEFPSAVNSQNPPPRSFLAFLPFLWSTVLFPGKSIPIERCRWLSILILVVVPGALLYPCLSFLLFEPDEGRYAEIPREMLARGEWIVPYLQGEPYLDKPPLLYWMVMGSYQLLGVHDWSARLIPALAVHGCILLTYLFGRRVLGERAAFWGALALSLAPGFITVGRLLVLDGLLAFWVILSWFAAWESIGRDRFRLGWGILAALACGFGILTKGPVALLLLAGPLIAYRWLGGLVCRTGWRSLGFLLAITLAVCLPWYVAVGLRLPSFASYFLWRQNVVRFLTPFDHQHPVWFYGPILLAGSLPISLIGFSWLRFLGSGKERTAALRGPALGFMILAGAWCVLFFSLAGSKLPTYILPAYPPLALALGYFFSVSHWRHSRLMQPVIGAALIFLGFGHYFGIPWYARFHSPMSRPEEVWRYCGDRATPVVCYPRNCDSVAFYLGRDDLRNYRSKEIGSLIDFIRDKPRTVMVFTHRHSPDSLEHFLPTGYHLKDLTPISRSWADGFRTEFCLMGVVEKDNR